MALSTCTATLNLTNVDPNTGDLVVKNQYGTTVFTIYSSFNWCIDRDADMIYGGVFDLTAILNDMASLLPAGWALDTTGSTSDDIAETITIQVVFTTSPAIGEAYGGYHLAFINCSTNPTITGVNIFTGTPMQILDTPQQYEPAHNDLPFVVSGTNNTQTNYKYWCDVYFIGSTSYDYRLFTFPRPDGFGFFNLKTIIRDYVSGDLDIPTAETFYRNSDMYKAYSVYFGESYGSTGTITSGMNSSGTYYAYDASLEWAEFISYSQNDRVIRTTGQGMFLTNQPQTATLVLTDTIKIGDSENAWLYMASKESNAIYRAHIFTFDSDGILQGTYTVNNPYSVLSSDDNRFLRFPSGTANIPRIASGDINVSAGSLPIITSNVKYYSIYLNDSALDISSKYVTYEVQSNCSRYDAYRLHYKNKWGGFDSFTFTMVNRENGEIERKSFKKMYGTISSAGNWAYTKKDRGITNYSTKSKRKLRLTSDWITQAQYELLIELIESPQVYWDDSGELHAVNILNSGYEVKTLKNEKVFNLELEVDFTQMNRRQ